MIFIKYKDNLVEKILKFIRKDKKNIFIFIALSIILLLITDYTISKLIVSSMHKNIYEGHKIVEYNFLIFLGVHKISTNLAASKAISLVLTASIYIVILINSVLKTKTESKDNLGSSSMGTISDLSGLTGNDGLILSQRVRLSEEKCFEHIGAFGPTGAGKSSTIFIPNLLSLPSNKSSVIIADPKGELFKKTSSYMRISGRNVLLFAPLSPKNSFFYNPIELASDVTEMREIAQSLLINGANAIAQLTGKTGGGDTEWINMAVPLWCAALLFVKEVGQGVDNISSALDLLISKSSEEIDFLLSNASENVQKQYNMFKTSSDAKQTASSIKSVLSSNLQLFTDPNIIKVSQKSEFNPCILRDKPTAVYIMCPENKSPYVSPFMSVFYSQIINKIMEYEGNYLPTYMLLDEFANIGIIPSFSRLAATCRSRKISLVLGIQGVEQIYENYGDKNGESILNNIKTKLFYPGLAPTTTEYASKLCGYTTVETISTSRQRNDTKNGGESISKSSQRRELLDANEIRTLDDDDILMILHNRPPVIDKQNKYYKSKKLLKKINEVSFPVRNDI